MRILVYGINYYPELTGIGKYTYEMCQWLADQGNQVTVITAFPYYPEWKIKKEYSGKWWHTEIINGVKVQRCPLYVPTRVSGFSRIIHEISYLLSSGIFWLPTFFQKKYDVVISVCPPTFSGIIPCIYKLVRRVPFLLHVQDLQLDAAITLGLIKNKAIIYIISKIEKFLLTHANTVSSISEGMKRNLLRKGIVEKKFYLLPNWVDTQFMKPSSKDLYLKNSFGITNNEIVILYAGNLGEKQGLEIIIETAIKLKNRRDICFLIVGEGAVKEKFAKQVKENNLKNIKLFASQPYEQLPALLNLADIHLVIQRKGASDLVMPSKMTGILSTGGLAIVSADSHSALYEMIRKHNLALVIEPDSSQSLFEAISHCLSINQLEIRQSARKFAEENLSIDMILSDLEKTLKELCQNP